MTKKEKLRELAMNNPIIHAGFMLHEHNDAPWEEVLELIVLALAEKCAGLEKTTVDALSRAMPESRVGKVPQKGE